MSMSKMEYCRTSSDLSVYSLISISAFCFDIAEVIELKVVGLFLYVYTIQGTKSYNFRVVCCTSVTWGTKVTSSWLGTVSMIKIIFLVYCDWGGGGV